jgi:hypothetical protein
LIIVARKVVDAFCQRHNPSPEQILELAELAAFDHQDINELVLNALLAPLQAQLGDKSLLILDQHLVSGLTTAVRALPSHFLEQNLEALLTWVEALSKWIDHRMNMPGNVDKCRVVLRNMSALLDAIADNSLMQSLTKSQEEEGVMAYLKKSVTTFDVNSLATLVTAGVEGGISGIGRVAKSYLNQGIDSIKHASPGDVSTTTVKGKGISQQDKNALKLIIAKLKNHSDNEVRYYVNYCEQALARIVGDEEGSQGQLLFVRGLHLIAGAKSVASIVLSQGLAINEYSQAIDHLTQV